MENENERKRDSRVGRLAWHFELALGSRPRSDKIKLHAHLLLAALRSTKALSRLLILVHPRSEQRDNVSSVRRRRGRRTDRSDRYDDLCRAACSDALRNLANSSSSSSSSSSSLFRNRSQKRASIVASWRPVIAASKHRCRANYLRADRVAFSGPKRRLLSRLRSTLPSNSKLVRAERANLPSSPISTMRRVSSRKSRFRNAYSTSDCGRAISRH